MWDMVDTTLSLSSAMAPSWADRSAQVSQTFFFSLTTLIVVSSSSSRHVGVADPRERLPA
ncbi:hypothetical protein BE04_18895 [Sorangium cellulosum]|uniref:Uncharacterized protein n=2 Tax=Sorangium cellulosum TaxID=56 RepID=A0A150PQK7_SORCE|nr:hypothetical protein SCE1572_32040 [Sorangium cellulosum So0157-2]KYF57933.1 hypothetical protein BE04_18895 [Sorangium cellulosum]